VKKQVLRTIVLSIALILMGAPVQGLAQSLAAGVALPPSYDTLQPPAVGGTYIDPAFGSTIQRVSNAMGTVNASAGGHLTWIENEYSTANAFNSDNSKFILVHESYFGLYDGVTGLYLSDLPFEINASSEPRWSRTDNVTLYYHSGNQLKRYNVSTGGIGVVHTFSEYSSISGNGEMDISLDGDHFVYVGDNEFVFVYQISTDQKFTVFDAGTHPFDSVYITPNNEVILSWCMSGNTRYTGQELFDINMNFLRQVGHADGHKHVTRDANGDEALIWTNSDDPMPIANCNNGIVKIRLADASQTCLLQLDWSLAVHISAPDGNGTVFVDTEAPANPEPGTSAWVPYTNELLQVKLDGSGTTRLAHHRSRPTSSYLWQPKLSASRDGTRLLFASDYDLSNIYGYSAQYADTYMMVLPKLSPASGSTGSPTTTAVAIVTGSLLPSATAGAFYSQALTASGGVAPYTWTLTSGALPAGLSLASGGAITGTPAAAGTSTFTVQAADSASAAASQSFSLTVAQGASCSYALNLGTQVFDASGGSATIGVTAGSGCAWAVSGAPGWVLVTAASGTGGGTVAYQVQANTGAARTGYIVIAGLTFTVVEQAGASVPVVPVYTAAGSMAQVASGGSWTTTITLVNNGAAPANLQLNFFDDNGSPLTLPLTFPQTASASPLMAATLNRTLGAGAGLVIATTGPASRAAQQGWAQLLADGAVSGFAVFASSISGGAQEAVAPLQSASTGSWVLWFDNTGGYATGVALANLASLPATVPAVVRDDTGTILAAGPVTLAALAHVAFVVTTQYPQTAGKRGSIEFQTPPGGQIGVLGLRASGSGALTSVPALTK